MIDFTIPKEIEKLKETTQKFILENVIPKEKDPRQDSHGPHDALRKELNEEARNTLYKQFQTIIHKQAPYIFLCSPLERLSITKRFEANSYIARPGYNEKEFILKNNSATPAH